MAAVHVLLLAVWVMEPRLAAAETSFSLQSEGRVQTPVPQRCSNDLLFKINNMIQFLQSCLETLTHNLIKLYFWLLIFLLLSYFCPFSCTQLYLLYLGSSNTLFLCQLNAWLLSFSPFLLYSPGMVWLLAAHQVRLPWDAGVSPQTPPEVDMLHCASEEQVSPWAGGRACSQHAFCCGTPYVSVLEWQVSQLVSQSFLCFCRQFTIIHSALQITPW